MNNNILFIIAIISILINGCDINSKPEQSGIADSITNEIEKSLKSDQKKSILSKKEHSAKLENSQKNSDNTIHNFVYDKPIMVETPNPVLKEASHPFASDSQGAESAAMVGLTVVDKHYTDTYVYITLLLRNFSTTSPNKRLHILGYDKNNRLISTNNSRIYFQPREQYLLTYNFKRADGITRWIFDLR